MGRMNPLHLTVAFVVMFSSATVRAVVVSNAQELAQAIAAANSGGDKMIECGNGTYVLDNILYVTADSVTVKSLSGDRDSVILQGQGMTGNVGQIFLVAASDFSVRDLTLGWVKWHGVQVQGEKNADRPSIRNVHIVDTYEQMVKVSGGDTHFSDDGIVENCLFEYSAGIGPQWYIGGVDAHRSRNWTVRGNVFRDIRSPGGSLAEHAIHFWGSSENTLVECNLIVNCDRGIGFGLGSSPHKAGIIRNNMIYHDTSEGFADVGIGLETSPGTQVYNNTIYHEHSYSNAIEYRFAATTGVLIANNLTNKNIRAREGASGTVSHNVTDVVSGWFVNSSAGDLHLDYEVPTVVDQGQTIAGLTTDFDGDTRPEGPGIDIGADEYTGGSIEESSRHNRVAPRLCHIYPNPFTRRTVISYQLPVVSNESEKDITHYTSHITLCIYDLGGGLVRSLQISKCPDHQISKWSWAGRDDAGRAVPSGMYLARLKVEDGFSRTQKLICIR